MTFWVGSALTFSDLLANTVIVKLGLGSSLKSVVEQASLEAAFERERSLRVAECLRPSVPHN